VVRQLRLRRDDRQTLEVEDEYDVQDLLYALLRLEFEEITTEDWYPRYAAGAARTDHLLRNANIVIIAKKTRTGVTVRDLTEQIKIDFAHYSERADCRTVMCFVYDPEGRIGNPRRLECDLTTVSDTQTLEVVISPK
jgi:REase_DpnII-MboI